MTPLWRGTLLLALFSIRVWAQPATRVAEIEAERDRKAAALAPEEVSGGEKVLYDIQQRKLLERIVAGIGGLRLAFGGLATGSGFALGPEYLRQDLAKGKVELRASARASFSLWQLYDVRLTMPKLAGDRLRLELFGVHRNYAGLNYYGPGPDSEKTGRTNFRREDNEFGAAARVNPARSLWLGVHGAYQDFNAGPGDNRRLASAEMVYTPQQAPGIDRQTDFWRTGASVQWDTRDTPGGPRRGGNYIASFDYYKDRFLRRHSFRRVEAEAQQYVPFFNLRRVIALRAKNTFTIANPGQRVPFYLQPVLGGSDDLRGFRPFRFYDDNLMVFNAEYRWESFSGLDMALFVDAGKVYQRPGQWNLKGLESSVGFGFRANIRNSVFLRTDVGFSHEGFQVWLKFNNVF